MSEGVHVAPNDSFGKKVGIFTAILAVLLSVFTISAHRAHTETIKLQSVANDQWAFYQAKRIRDDQLELNADLLKVLAVNNVKASQLIAIYAAKHNDYVKKLQAIKTIAEDKMQESQLFQQKALLFDFAEGILEIALVMSSLYFISRKKYFPVLGVAFATLGLIVGVFGFLQ